MCIVFSVWIRYFIIRCINLVLLISGQFPGENLGTPNSGQQSLTTNIRLNFEATLLVLLKLKFT
ncbi:hypothetical protein M758_4G015900 [Ceratodon purpureus]|nr:hypothetical protein M758_4G015900 [Ceratodon purpureus]